MLFSYRTVPNTPDDGPGPSELVASGDAPQPKASGELATKTKNTVAGLQFMRTVAFLGCATKRAPTID